MENGEARHDMSARRTGDDRAVPHRTQRTYGQYAVRIFWLFSLAILVVFVGGFLRFADIVSGMMPPADPSADAIVVLTGGSQRIDQAVSLLESGAGARLLISGVHPATSGNQIRRMTQASEKLFTCCVDIGHEALDTIGNANETVHWIKERGYKRILVVTNNYHMPRSLYELQRLDPQTEFIAYPVVGSNLKEQNWLTNGQILRNMVAEYLKLTLAIGRHWLGLYPTDGLRRSVSVKSPSDVKFSGDVPKASAQ